MTTSGKGTSIAAWASVIVACVGLIGAAVVAFIQWRSDVEVEQKRLDAQLKLEEQRFRSELILRALKPESERDRRDLLTFLHRAGLVDGLGPVLDSYKTEGGGFLPRAEVSFNEVSTLMAQRGLTPKDFPTAPPQPTIRLPSLDPGTPARRLMLLASTPDGRNPTADQRVAEAVRLALEGSLADHQRALQLLAEAGYPEGFSLELSIAAYERLGGSREEATALVRALEAIGIFVKFKT